MRYAWLALAVLLALGLLVAPDLATATSKSQGGGPLYKASVKAGALLFLFLICLFPRLVKSIYRWSAKQFGEEETKKAISIVALLALALAVVLVLV